MTGYVPRRRTALVLSGTGTAGAYHAGVSKALREAGVKVDLVAGCGIGVAAALVAAIDGDAALWDAQGVWRSAAVSRWYGWRPDLRVAAWALAGAAAGLLVSLGADGAGVLAHLVGTASRPAAPGAAVAPAWWGSALATAAPIGRAVAMAGIVLAAGVLVGARLVGHLLAHTGRRRARGGRGWSVILPPLSAARVQRQWTRALWRLLRGAASVSQPAPADLSARYAELLSDNLGQPGFRELVLVVHDLDARADLIFALLAPAARRAFFPRPGTAELERRALETIDLAGVGRTHVVDALWGALALPVATAPHRLVFPPESPWRGETHRLVHRPEALSRLVEELARAGAEQLILVSAVAPCPGPHALDAARRDLRGALGEVLAAREAAAARDALAWAAGHLAAVFLIQPAHNPVGPLDLGGAYDERSDRWHSVAELMARGYEDAYRQFIEPVVGASGEGLGAVREERPPSRSEPS